MKVMNALKEVEIEYGIDSGDTVKIINSLNEIKKIRQSGEGECEQKSQEVETDEVEEEDTESLVFSSESKISGSLLERLFMT